MPGLVRSKHDVPFREPFKQERTKRSPGSLRLFELFTWYAPGRSTANNGVILFCIQLANVIRDKPVNAIVNGNNCEEYKSIGDAFIVNSWHGICLKSQAKWQLMVVVGVSVHSMCEPSFIFVFKLTESTRMLFQLWMLLWHITSREKRNFKNNISIEMIS